MASACYHTVGTCRFNDLCVAHEAIIPIQSTLNTQVFNIAPSADEASLREFFAFCGTITVMEIRVHACVNSCAHIDQISAPVGCDAKFLTTCNFCDTRISNLVFDGPFAAN